MNSEEVRSQIEEMEKDLNRRMAEIAEARKRLIQLQMEQRPFTASDGAKFDTKEQLQDYEDRARLNQIYTRYRLFNTEEDYDLVLSVLTFHLECTDSLSFDGRVLIENDQDVKIVLKNFKHYFPTGKYLAPGGYYLFSESYNGDNYGGSDSYYVLSRDELKAAISTLIDKANDLIRRVE